LAIHVPGERVYRELRLEELPALLMRQVRRQKVNLVPSCASQLASQAELSVPQGNLQAEEARIQLLEGSPLFLRQLLPWRRLCRRSPLFPGRAPVSR
jgi:hypothetical protein